MLTGWAGFFRLKRQPRPVRVAVPPPEAFLNVIAEALTPSMLPSCFLLRNMFAHRLAWRSFPSGRRPAPFARSLHRLAKDAIKSALIATPTAFQPLRDVRIDSGCNLQAFSRG